MSRGRAARGLRDDRGSAVVEFVGVALVLLVPLVYLVVAVGQVEAATFAAEGAAREAARAFVASDDAADAAPRALAAARVALADGGLADQGPADQGPADDSAAGSPDGLAGAVSIGCSDVCLTPGSDVTVEVRLRVPLPFVPSFLRRAVPLAIPVVAARTAVVDQYRAAP